MTYRKQSLHEFLEDSFARFRALPASNVDLACEGVLSRLRREPNRDPEAVDTRTFSRRRYGRMIVLVAATAATVVLAEQLSMRMLPPAPATIEVAPPVAVPQAVGLTQQAAPEPPKPPATAPKPLAFGAASIRRIAPDVMNPAAGLACRGTDGAHRIVLAVLKEWQDTVTAPQGRCLGSAIFLTTLIEMAYGFPPGQISGGPEWSRRTGSMIATPGGGAVVSLPMHVTPQGFAWYEHESFQIEAIADNPSTATLDQLRQMLRELLANRFKLRYHLEKKEMPGYSLVVSEKGHKLKPISGDYVESLLLFQGRSTMDRFAHTLSSFLFNRVHVVDKTGLEGPFEYVFEYRPPGQDGGGRGAGGGGAPRANPPAPAGNRPENVSRQLEEQLGLRLQNEDTVLVDAFVIDSVELPTPN
jgi:uncharacterized protein (TIGR03435 family)